MRRTFESVQTISEAVAELTPGSIHSFTPLVRLSGHIWSTGGELAVRRDVVASLVADRQAAVFDPTFVSFICTAPDDALARAVDATVPAADGVETVHQVREPRFAFVGEGRWTLDFALADDPRTRTTVEFDCLDVVRVDRRPLSTH